jgi:hypothetical protein
LINKWLAFKWQGQSCLDQAWHGPKVTWSNAFQMKDAAPDRRLGCLLVIFTQLHDKQMIDIQFPSS